MNPFHPHPLLRGANMQTVVSSLVTGDTTSILAREAAVVVDAGPDQTGYDPGGTVRLIGYFNAAEPTPTAEPSRGLVLTLHGWEGCSHSTYNLMLSQGLLAAGYDVFRLNMRDHGPNLGLNPGFFYSTLLDEVATAVGRVGEMAGDRPFYVVGASLGGNFALRLAVRHAHTPIPNLRHVIAINPALDPVRTSRILDRKPFYRNYFRRRWLKSLLTKQELFPHLYDFSPLVEMPLLWDMTEWLIQNYHFDDYPNAEAYFSAYAVSGEMLRNLAVPTTVLTAADDPIIPAEDFRAFPQSDMLRTIVQPFGGHVGYVDLWPVRHRLPGMVVELLENSLYPGYPVSSLFEDRRERDTIPG